MTAGDRDYVARLGAVLRQQRVPALRAFLEEQAARFGDERQVSAIREQPDDELELLLHRMILARGDLADLHARSQRFLAGQAGPPPPGPRAGRPAPDPGSGPAGPSANPGAGPRPGPDRRGSRNGRGAGRRDGSSDDRPPGLGRPGS